MCVHGWLCANICGRMPINVNPHIKNYKETSIHSKFLSDKRLLFNPEGCHGYKVTHCRDLTDQRPVDLNSCSEYWLSPYPNTDGSSVCVLAIVGDNVGGSETNQLRCFLNDNFDFRRCWKCETPFQVIIKIYRNNGHKSQFEMCPYFSFFMTCDVSSMHEWRARSITPRNVSNSIWQFLNRHISWKYFPCLAAGVECGKKSIIVQKWKVWNWYSAINHFKVSPLPFCVVLCFFSQQARWSKSDLCSLQNTPVMSDPGCVGTWRTECMCVRCVCMRGKESERMGSIIEHGNIHYGA